MIKKMRSLLLALVRINVTREISYIQKEIGNMPASRETKERMRIRPTFTKKRLVKSRDLLCISHLSLFDIAVRNGYPSHTRLTTWWHSYLPSWLLQLRNSTVNTIPNLFSYGHVTILTKTVSTIKTVLLWFRKKSLLLSGHWPNE